MSCKEKAWIELDSNKLKNNLDILKKNNPNQEIWAVVKDDAYNHGINLLFKIFLDREIYNFCVVSFTEALHLQNLANVEKVHIKILILGYISNQEIQNVPHNWRISVYNLDLLKQWSEVKLLNKLKVHIKIDSGMNRKGIKNSIELKQVMNIILSNDNFELEGFYTHYASSSADISFMETQFTKFSNLIRSYTSKVKYIHSQNSYACMNLKREFSQFNNIIRPGGWIYGLTGKESKIYKPIISLYSIVLEKKKVLKGETIGYDRKFKINEDGYIGVFFLGYVHGFRSTNSMLNIYINGHKATVIGKICMDQSMFFINKDVFNIYDKIEIISEKNSLFYVASHNSIEDYELVCSFSKNIKRLVI